MRHKILLAALALVLCAAPALAHNMWLVPADQNPQVGQELEVRIGFGHTYPANRVDQEVRPGMIKEVLAVGPDGKEIQLTQKGDDLYTLGVTAPGAYLISAVMKPGYFSQGKGGFKRGNKQQLEGVEKCMFFQMIANAPVFAGEAAAAQDAPKSQSLQLLPLADITNLKAGDKLPVQIVFDGKPLADTKITATYAGFEPPKGPEFKPDPSLSPKEQARQKMMHRSKPHYPVNTVTDAQGKADITFPAKGWWLILLGHSTPYEDTAVCDKNMFKTTYTFEVRKDR